MIINSYLLQGLPYKVARKRKMSTLRRRLPSQPDKVVLASEDDKADTDKNESDDDGSDDDDDTAIS